MKAVRAVRAPGAPRCPNYPLPIGPAVLLRLSHWLLLWALCCLFSFISLCPAVLTVFQGGLTAAKWPVRVWVLQLPLEAAVPWACSLGAARAVPRARGSAGYPSSPVPAAPLDRRAECCPDSRPGQWVTAQGLQWNPREPPSARYRSIYQHKGSLGSAVREVWIAV